MRLQSRDPHHFGQFAPVRKPQSGPPVWVWILTGLMFVAGLVLGFVLLPSLMRYLFGV